MNMSRFISIILILVLIIAAWFMILKIRHAYGDKGKPPENFEGTDISVVDSGNAESGSGSARKKSNTKQDWRFLKGNSWEKLAQLTGLPRNWTSSDANLWAVSLMREADPDFSGELTAQDFKENPKINLLVEAADQPNGSNGQPDTDAVFKRWTELKKGSVGDSLLELAYALGDPVAHSTVATSNLKDILSAWEQALLKLAKSDPEVEQIVQASTPGVSLEAAMSSGVPGSKNEMITESDLRRYNALNDFLNHDYFTNKIAVVTAGENFASLDWQVKVKRLSEIGQMSAAVGTPIAVFCKDLYEAATKTPPR